MIKGVFLNQVLWAPGARMEILQPDGYSQGFVGVVSSACHLGSVTSPRFDLEVTCMERLLGPKKTT